MDNIKKICELIEERQEELYELLCKLIRINSENFGTHGNEKECAEYIHALSQEWGFESDMYSPMELEGFEDHPDYIPGRSLEDRYNVTVRMRGAEDSDELMLMGHSDTVVIGDPTRWSIEPLSGVVKDGKIWGRGATDDKYAIAVGLFLMRLLKESGFVPRKNLLFSAYCDEEKGGSHGALAAVLRYPCARIVNMDSLNSEIWHCASGGGETCYRYHTKEAVDSAMITAEAIPVVMEVINEFAKHRREELEANRFYKGTNIPDTSLRYLGVRAGNEGADLGVGEIGFVYYTDKTKKAIDEEFDAMEKTLSERLEPLGIIGDGFFPTTRFFDYIYAEPDCATIQDMQQAARETAGRELPVCGSALSDMSIIAKYGTLETITYGAGRGFNAYGGAHQADEFIGCEELLEYTKIIAAYILKVLG